MALSESYKQFDESAQEALAWLVDEAARLRSGRITPDMISSMAVDHYGAKTPLNGLATISNTDARTLTIVPWDMAALVDIEKALNEANLGASPVNDGKAIRLGWPMMNEDVRQETVKVLQQKAEEARVRMRQARDEALTTMKQEKKLGELTEDDWHDGKKELDARIGAKNQEIEDLVKRKEAEIIQL